MHLDLVHVFFYFMDRCASVDVFVCLCALKPIYLMGTTLCLSLKDMAAFPVPLNVVSCLGGTNHYACAHIVSEEKMRDTVLVGGQEREKEAYKIRQ